jgi:hypothetical protein
MLEELLTTLTPRQQEAVAHSSGPLLERVLKLNNTCTNIVRK